MKPPIFIKGECVLAQKGLALPQACLTRDVSASPEQGMRASRSDARAGARPFERMEKQPLTGGNARTTLLNDITVRYYSYCNTVTFSAYLKPPPTSPDANARPTVMMRASGTIELEGRASRSLANSGAFDRGSNPRP